MVNVVAMAQRVKWWKGFTKKSLNIALVSIAFCNVSILFCNVSILFSN